MRRLIDQCSITVQPPVMLTCKNASSQMWLTRLCQWLSTTYFLFPVACHLFTLTKLPELLACPNPSLPYLSYQESFLSCHSSFILLAWPGKLPGNLGNLGFTSFDSFAAIDGSPGLWQS